MQKTDKTKEIYILHKIVMIYTSREVYEYISKQTNDPIVERKTCVVSGTLFPIYQSDLDFYTKISPTFAGEKFQIPTPSLCPEERQRRRLSFRNERKLYKRTCDATGDQIISMYSPINPFKIYNQGFWWSDSWDPMIYGRDFDFNRTFTEQFYELSLLVPRCSLLTEYITLINSNYINLAGPSKDCYMITETDRCEGCYYGYTIYDCNYCVDCSYIYFSELCYESVDIKNSYKLSYCRSCYNCKDCALCVDCSNISHCYGCRNLNEGEYMINNKQYTKEEYDVMMQEIGNVELVGNNLKKAYYGIQNSGNTIGNFITHSQNLVFCFDVDEDRDCKYVTLVHHAQDCMDYFSRGGEASLIYEAQNSGFGFTNSSFCNYVRNNCSNILYSDLCPINNSHIFGCIGLRNKQYCIFNKQYTKEDYEIMVGRIIRHMQTTGERGEFFHPSLSPFGYNETVAQEYYPIEIQNSKFKIKNGNIDYSQFGYHRSTYSSDPKIPDGVKTIDCRQPEWAEDSEQWKQLNQMTVGTHGNVSVVGDSESIQQNYDICKQIILCELSGRPFMLQKAEIDFYRKHSIYLPRKHPDVRHEERMKLRPGRTLFLRNCDCCGKEMLSVYPVGTHGNASVHSNVSEQQVYCESCYQKEIYG